MTASPLPTVVSWSSGKDSAWALHELRKNPRYEVGALLTTFNQEFDRVAMHAVRRELAELQASSLGLPLSHVDLPWPCSNEEYEIIVGKELDRLEEAGYRAMAFGDLFLQDVRAYRERLFRGRKLDTLFPIWQRSTPELALEMIESGLQAVVTCLDPEKLPLEFAGRAFDIEFLHQLPPDIDPCGENGEFHTFCWDGPMFRQPLPVRIGEVVERDGFVFCDLLLV